MTTHQLRFWGSLAFSLLCAMARANTFDFQAILSGAAESPPNASPGTGTADVVYDDVLNTLWVDVTFSGLIGTTTASHIHAATASPGTGTAGVATTVPTFAGFPLGVTSGTYINTLDLTSLGSYNPSYVTAHGGSAAGAESALISALFAGEAYLNIHTTHVPGGEIRGFLNQVPDSSATVALLALALFAMLGFARYQRALAT
jgi:CHRD domain